MIIYLALNVLVMQLALQLGYGFKILPYLVHDLFQLFMHDPLPLDAMRYV